MSKISWGHKAAAGKVELPSKKSIEDNYLSKTAACQNVSKHTTYDAEHVNTQD